jgi:hypothetical protein
MKPAHVEKTRLMNFRRPIISEATMPSFSTIINQRYQMQLTLTEWNGLLKFKHGSSGMVVYGLAFEESNGQCLFS